MPSMRLPTFDCSKVASSCAIMLDIDTLQAIAEVLNRAVDSHPFELSHLARDVLDYLRDYGRIAGGVIGIINDDTGALETFTALARDEGAVIEGVMRRDEGPIGAIMNSGDPMVVSRAGDSALVMSQFGGFDLNLPFIGVPLFMLGREPVGVIIAQPSDEPGPLDGHAKFIGMLATLLGQSIHIARVSDRERAELLEERDNLRRAVRNQHVFENIVGKTEAMQALFGQVKLVAKWNTTVLIRGESGTGKELIANAIHYNSPRADGPFVKLNCAALPDNLLESELFGHEKGSFTGASTQRKGRFEQADGGTLFLDEIGEITPAFQSKLLRVLQEGEFERVGGHKTMKVDVRIIAATNRNLEAEVESGEFREDLYYRLNVMPLNMPPLRDRKDDIPELSQFLLKKIGDDQGRKLSITSSAQKLLSSHDWPGNVRELENCLERASVMSQVGAIDRDVISLIGIGDGRMAPSVTPRASPAPSAMMMNGGGAPAPAAPMNGHGALNGHAGHGAMNGAPPPSLNGGVRPNGFRAANPAAAGSGELDDPELDERSRVIAALEEAGWVQAKAARLLGMTPRQIAYRIQTLDIQVRRI